MGNQPLPRGPYTSFYDAWGSAGLNLPLLQRPLEEREELHNLELSMSKIHTSPKHPYHPPCHSLGGMTTSPLRMKIRDFEIVLYWHDWNLCQLCIY